MRLPWRRPGAFTVVLLPEEGGESRTLHFSSRAVGTGMALAIALGAAWAVMAGSWWSLAHRAWETNRLREEVDSLRAERGQVRSLAEELGRIEAEYERLRSLFGPAAPAVSSDLWLPPSGLPLGDPGQRTFEDERPTSWPLTQPGFVTQALAEGETGDHPGLDIAVGSGSYVRAAGAGTVLRVGEDPVYGLFVVLDHGEGYESLYAHVSQLFVTRGDSVLKEEVIALSGSTGQSTAPHLHFEILLDGTPLDPLSLVQQPG